MPAARSWRDIPQPVKPRAMSRGGQWRLTLAILRTAAVIGLVGALGWSGWMVANALQESSRVKPAAARAVPVKAPVPVSDGVLDGDGEWLARTLRLPKRAALMDLDLEQLRQRLLADRQVLTAGITRHFPDRLEVRITERTPVVRVMAEVAGDVRMLLVARDGAVFEGTGYDPALLGTLPWLGGVGIVRREGKYQPVADMEVAAELLGRMRLEAERLYRAWHVISLARLRSDREIEVRTRGPQPVTIVFSAAGDFLPQIAKLDYMWDALVGREFAEARIDLSLGRQVPVTIAPVAGGTQASLANRRPSTSTYSIFSPSQSRTPREL